MVVSGRRKVVSHRLFRFPNLLRLSVVLVLAWPSLANELRLQTIELPREGSASLSLSFDPQSEAVAAIQFDLDYDHSAIELIPNIGDAGRRAAKSIYFADVSTTKRRFVIAGLNQTQISAGELIDFVAAATSTAALQRYPLTISNVFISSPGGYPGYSSLISGEISITAGTGPRLSAGNIRSAASLNAEPIAPGKIITLFGTGIGPLASATPREGPSSLVLGATSVWFGGQQAPLLYADSRQINAVVPFSVMGDSAEVVVKNGGVTWSTRVPVWESSPALFTLSGGGAGPGAILNENGRINDLGNPADRGSIVAVFGTGAGQMNPQGVDGAIAQGASQFPRLPVSAKIGGLNAEVLYAGAAPGLIAGVLQVNLRIPADAPVGPAVEIVVTVGNVSSPAGVTLVIR